MLELTELVTAAAAATASVSLRSVVVGVARGTIKIKNHLNGSYIFSLNLTVIFDTCSVSKFFNISTYLVL